MQAAALDDVGFVRDYRELSALKKFLDKTGDHNHLNDVLGHDKTRASGISMPHALTAPLLSVCILDVAS